MAASIHNHQLINHRSDSPTRGCNFTPFNSQPFNPKSPSDFPRDDDSEDEQEYNKSLYQTKQDVEPSIYDPRDERTLDSWIKRNPSLIRLTGKHPFNCEPPLARLMECGFITPTPLHYVRNHGSVPKADWSTWTVEITGLVKHPVRFTVDQLVHEFDPIEMPVTLVCAGNRRKEQNMVRQTVGFNWGPGAISTSVWRGVRLCDVLKRCGIMGRKNGALNVCFEGADELSGGGGCKYGTSVRREVAMDPSRDIMLVYMQNGEALMPDHGFPIRVIVPGFIGGRMVKWLKRIVVTTQESDSYYHYNDNRVLPSHIDAELANAEAWWYKPEYIINELNINSVMTTPGHDEVLPITSHKPFTMKGYAYSGGGRKVTRVEITLDGGETWRVCTTLEHPEKPSKYGKYWCWCFWSLEVEILDLLGAKEVAVRAWDESLNTQPEKLIWNVKGMMNNCWFRVKINICRPNRGEIGLMFEHPVQPGNQSGGWMAKQMHIETVESAHSLKKSMSAPFMNTATKQFTFREVSKHSTKDSAWIVVRDQVYDCTSFLKDHPGGTDSILINAGTDCTEEFESIHSDKAKVLLDMYRIGELVADGRDDSSNENDGSVHGKSQLITINETITGTVKALANPREKVQCKLVYKKEISRDVRLFRFALPSPDHVLGLPVGKHVFVYANIEGKQCIRAYTPTSTPDQVGHFDLVIKIYFKGDNPKFPKGGLLTQHLESLPLNSIIDIKGPLGHIEYTGCGNFMINGKQKFAREVTLVAGGSGITPVYQVIQAVLRDQPNDTTKMHLIYANRTEDDILLRDELDQWAAMYPNRLKVWYVISQVKGPIETWSYSVGRVNECILREHVPVGSEDTLAFACGPPQMIQSSVLPNLAKMNYDVENSCFVF